MRVLGRKSVIHRVDVVAGDTLHVTWTTQGKVSAKNTYKITKSQTVDTAILLELAPEQLAELGLKAAITVAFGESVKV